MSELNSHRTIGKTKKEHVCELCGGVIPIGSKCEKYVFSGDGGFGSFMLHTGCDEIIGGYLQMEDEDEWSPSMVRQSMYDEVCLKKCLGEDDCCDIEPLTCDRCRKRYLEVGR